MGLLLSNELDEFHMVDAANFRGVFTEKSAKWGELRLRKRDAIVRAFIEAIRQSGLVVVAISAEAALLSDKNIAAKKRDVFERVVRELDAKVPPSGSLAFICDREQDLARPVLDWINRLQVSEPRLSERIAGVCYMQRRTILQIQAATTIASKRPCKPLAYSVKC
jgi:hypothetical protein